jgi:hypothetical protein
MEAQKADFGAFEFGRQIEELGKYLDLRTACRKLFCLSAILHTTLRIRA